MFLNQSILHFIIKFISKKNDLFFKIVKLHLVGRDVGIAPFSLKSRSNGHLNANFYYISFLWKKEMNL